MHGGDTRFRRCPGNSTRAPAHAHTPHAHQMGPTHAMHARTPRVKHVTHTRTHTKCETHTPNARRTHAPQSREAMPPSPSSPHVSDLTLLPPVCLKHVCLSACLCLPAATMQAGTAVSSGTSTANALLFNAFCALCVVCVCSSRTTGRPRQPRRCQTARHHRQASCQATRDGLLGVCFLR